MENLNLYLVAPKGYEERSSVVVATSKEEAKEKAMRHPAIKEITDAGGKLTVLDISQGLAAQGYVINVTRIGMYH